MFLRDFLSAHTLNFFKLSDHIKNKTEVFNFLLNYSSKLFMPVDSNSIFPEISDLTVDSSDRNLVYEIIKCLTVLKLCRKLHISALDKFSRHRFFLASYENFLRYFLENRKPLESIFPLDGNFLCKEFDLLGASDSQRAAFLCVLKGSFNDISNIYKYLKNLDLSECIESLSESAAQKIYSLVKESKSVEFFFDFGWEFEITANCDILFDSNILVFTNKSLADDGIQENLVTVAACDLLAKEFHSSNLKNKYIYSFKTNQLFVCK